MTKTRKSVPALATEAEERAHWEREESTADLDWSIAESVRLPNLRPSTTAIWLTPSGEPISGTRPIRR
ncbi:CopG antitoxin of type II toxin-antitoxin system [Roseiarcus fermentans]|uniref:CopG antitoxin of type II toxin-antitoxin system n=1 Tax=Roseiarcus fermentans TaxID=1473586 RepID=A0A366FIM7_9HYPH|nr:CopG antitoxin of type II toxin-antitoxin system [Roseiarcus fermentans]